MCHSQQTDTPPARAHRSAADRRHPARQRTRRVRKSLARAPATDARRTQQGGRPDAGAPRAHPLRRQTHAPCTVTHAPRAHTAGACARSKASRSQQPGRTDAGPARPHLSASGPRAPCAATRAPRAQVRAATAAVRRWCAGGAPMAVPALCLRNAHTFWAAFRLHEALASDLACADCSASKVGTGSVCDLTMAGTFSFSFSFSFLFWQGSHARKKPTEPPIC